MKRNKLVQRSRFPTTQELETPLSNKLVTWIAIIAVEKENKSEDE